MFTNEIATVHKLTDLVGSLSYSAESLNNHACDLETAFEDFMKDEAMLEPLHANYLFDSMTRSERDAANELVQFDRVLNHVINERRKLGNFILTPTV